MGCGNFSVKLTCFVGIFLQLYRNAYVCDNVLVIVDNQPYLTAVTSRLKIWTMFVFGVPYHCYYYYTHLTTSFPGRNGLLCADVPLRNCSLTPG